MYKSADHIAIKGVEHLYPAERLDKGNVAITKYVFEADALFNIRQVFAGFSQGTMEPGTYVRLHVDGQLMMSDTLMERRSNLTFHNRAHGRILIAGLGIGLILPGILNREDVSEVIVVEKNQDVIDLVASRFEHPKLTIVCEDIFNYKPEGKFNVIYFDIWPEISEDNLDEIKVLHNRFKFKLDRTDPNCWMDSWMKPFLQERRNADRRRNAWRVW